MIPLLKKRRSVRRYKEQKVSKEQIDILMKAALLSPSSRNLRPWEFVVITDKKLLEQLSRAKLSGSSFLSKAPLGIVVLGDSSISDVWIEDTSIAATIIQLTAQSIGLGSCWIQIRQREHNGNVSAEQYVQSVLHIPNIKNVLAIIAIGHADVIPPSHRDDALDSDKIHLNQYQSR